MNQSIAFFVNARPASFKWPVRVPVPGDGKYTFLEVSCTFKYLDDEQEKALLEPAAARSDRDILAEVLLGVEGMKYEDGSPVPSSPALVAQFILVDRVAPVAVGTYLAARRGLAAEKN